MDGNPCLAPELGATRTTKHRRGEFGQFLIRARKPTNEQPVNSRGGPHSDVQEKNDTHRTRPRHVKTYLHERWKGIRVRIIDVHLRQTTDALIFSCCRASPNNLVDDTQLSL